MSKKPRSPGAAVTAHGADDVEYGNATAPRNAEPAGTASANLVNGPDHIGEIAFAFDKRGDRIRVMAGERKRGQTHFLDIREWIGGLIPTGKGIAIPLDEVGRLGEALVHWDKACRGETGSKAS